MKNKQKFLDHSDEWNQEMMFGPNVGFAVSESYKLLRANVMYSFSSESRCHVIGVMSSVRGEGKSTTACNLAYALMEAGRKTLLMEGDLRLPSIPKKLGLQQEPGLSELLVMNVRMGDVIQHCELAPKMDVITAGSPTPNPSELLGSNVFKEVMKELISHYEYIVIDLPPVTAVSDALVVSELLDGVVMVVRNNYVTRKDLAEAMRQLKLVDVRILGFAYRGTNQSSYAKKYKAYQKSADASAYKKKSYKGYSND